MKKKIFSLIAIMMVATLILTGCGGSSQSNSANTDNNNTKFTMKVANILAEDDPETLGLKKFKELVESKSEGNIIVELYPNAQLGAAETYLDSLRQGVIQMASPGSVMAQLQPLVAAPEMPFIFNDWDHAKKVLTDPELTDILAEGMIEKHGVRCVGFAPRGFRVISSNKKISSMEDFKGFRIRTPNIPFYIKLFEALGASPVALPLTELFSALEQNVVTGQENPYATIETSKFYEVQDYIFESNHIFTTHGWYINEKFFQSLPENYQQIIVDSAQEAINYIFDILIEQETKAKATMEEHGVEVTVPSEALKKQMVEAAQPALEFFYETYPGSKDWAEKVRAIK